MRPRTIYSLDRMQTAAADRRQRRQAAAVLKQLRLQKRGRDMRFGVEIYGEHGLKELRIFVNRAQAMARFFPAALAAAQRSSVRDDSGRFFPIKRAVAYDIRCSDDEEAIRRISDGSARVIADSTGALGVPDLVLRRAFQKVQ